MSYDLLIRGGTVTTARDSCLADVAVSGGKIAAVGRDLAAEGSKTVEAEGLVVLPGGIDAHTHLDMPFMGATTADDFASGTTAAACGGTTTIIDFATQERGHGLRAALDVWHRKAQGKSAVDYGFHMIVVDLPESRLPELDALVGEGVPNFKLFMAYAGTLMSDDATILSALQRSTENGGMVSIHAENGSAIALLVRQALARGQTAPKYHALTRPPDAEIEATRRAIALAHMAHAPLYVVHVTCADAMDEVRRARERGQAVLGETCPQYLYLCDDDYERPGFEGAKFVMSPPLRPKGNQERLWEGLAQGWLQVVATDHCSFNMKDQGGKPGKELGKDDFSKIPNGAPGIETRLPLLWDAVARGRLSPQRFVELTSTAPAKIFGLYPRKGTIAPGADADLVLLDPRKSRTIRARELHMNVDYNPYEGREVRGAIQDVYVRGRLTVDGGRFVGTLSHGTFLKRSARRESCV